MSILNCHSTIVILGRNEMTTPESVMKDSGQARMTKVGFLGTILAQDPRGVFGTIRPPDEILPLIRKGGEGAGGISLVLSNLVNLIYMVAGVVFVFMIIWGAFQWLTSGGDKEAVAAARGRIINALVGIILFAIAFAVLSIVGTFTGFTFFTE